MPPPSAQGRRLTAIVLVGCCVLLLLRWRSRHETPPAATAAAPHKSGASHLPAATAQPAETQPQAPKLVPSKTPPGTKPSGGRGGKAGTRPDESLTVQGKVRQYRLVVPESIRADQPAPLVFAFHGLGDSKDIMPWYSQLSQLAEREGFVLVYPNGQNRH